ncbi:hypothetical protein ACFX13_041102 [Malus domestica]|uniref:Ubiquitin-like domain-containing protein n=1 Tax=Pyrus ussuriensis x Pyrus communis TaxID=2448454 RepID=A0A5N5F1Z7_9ROSA|nr:uncharacterized protein LOC103964214 [Pyrus x bretschneideri]KAB2595220.1 hypothetical protein D8674_030670 [Pyrus ussuriensis x Pyrus communis]
MTMKVVVENLTGTLFYVQVGKEATVADLKREIEAQQKLPYHRLILILDTDSDDRHCSRLMNDDADGVLLVDYGVQDGSHVYVFLNPLDDGSTNHLFELNWCDSLLG